MASVTVERLEAEVEVDVAKAIADLQAFKAAVRDATSVDGRASISTDYDSGGVRSAARGLSELKDAADEAIGRPGGGGDGGGGKGLLGVSSAAKGGSLRFKALATAVLALGGPAATGINSLVGATLGLTGALAPATGLLATMPQGFAAFGQGATVAVAGLKGIGDALKEVEQAKGLKEQQEILRSMNPEMRRMVETVRGPLKNAWASIQGTAQAGLLSGVNDAIASAMPLFQQLTPVIAATATVMGELTRTFGEFLGSSGFGRDFAAIGQSNVRVLQSLGEAAQSVFEGFTKLMVAAAPLTEAVARGIANMANSFQAWTTAGSQGGFQSFFQETLSVVSQLKGIFGDLAGALGNVIQAATPLGREILDALTRVSAEAKAWTDDMNNASGMTNFFNSMKEPLRAIAGLVADVVKAFRDMQDSGTFTQIINSIRDVLPPLADALKAMGNVGALIGEVVAFAAPLLRLAEAIGMVANALADLIGLVAPLGGFITVLGGLGVALKGIKLASYARGFAQFAAGAATGQTATAALAAKLGVTATALGAVTGVVGGVAMGVKILGDNAAEGATHFDNFMASLGEPQTMQQWSNQINSMNTEYERLNGNYRGAAQGAGEFLQAITPMESTLGRDREAALRLEQALETANRGFARIQAQARSLVGDLGRAEAAFESWLFTQSRMGITYATSLDANMAYAGALRQTAADLREVKEQAEATAVTLRQDAAAADQELADANRDLSRTLKDTAIDTRALRDAQESAAEAAKDLAESYHEAAEHLEDLRFASRRSILSEQRAINSLQDAYARLADIQSGVGEEMTEITKVTDYFTGKVYEVARITKRASSTAKTQEERERELRDALLDVKEAQLAVEEAKDATSDAARLLAEAERKGILQSDLVVQAQRRLRDANEAVADAIKAQQKQAEANALAQEQAQRRVSAATQRQKDSHEALRRHMTGPMARAIADYKRVLADLNRVFTTIMELGFRPKPGTRSFLETLVDLAKAEEAAAAAGGGGGGATKQLAVGGPVRGGGSYIVGEEGPEMFKPRVSGTIIPARQTAALMGGSGSKDNLSAAQIEAIVTSVVGRMQKPAIEQNFYERVDPVRMGAELSWRLQ
jgi:hypothetical protein